MSRWPMDIRGDDLSAITKSNEDEERSASVMHSLISTSLTQTLTSAPRYGVKWSILTIDWSSDVVMSIDTIEVYRLREFVCTLPITIRVIIVFLYCSYQTHLYHCHLCSNFPTFLCPVLGIGVLLIRHALPTTEHGFPTGWIKGPQASYDDWLPSHVADISYSW